MCLLKLLNKVGQSENTGGHISWAFWTVSLVGTAGLLINDDDEPSNERTVFSEKSQLIVTEKRSDNTV